MGLLCINCIHMMREKAAYSKLGTFFIVHITATCYTFHSRAGFPSTRTQILQGVFLRKHTSIDNYYLSEFAQHQHGQENWFKEYGQPMRTADQRASMKSTRRP